MQHHIRLFLGAICISFAPILVKSVSLSPTTIGVYRCLVGSVVLLLIGFLKRPRQEVTKVGIDPKLLWLVLLGGLIFATDLYVWHRSVVYVGAGLGTILGNTQVFYLTLIGLIWFQQRLSLYFYLGVGLAFVGVYLAVGQVADWIKPEEYLPGILYGLATGFVYSIYLTTLAAIERRGPLISSFLKLGGITMFAGLFLFFVALFEGSLRLPSFTEAGYMALLGLVAQVLGWILITKNLPHVPIGIGGLILLAQPIGAVVMGRLIYAEILATSQWIGIAMALIGIYLGTVGKKPAKVR